MITLIHSQAPGWTQQPERTDEENGDRPELFTLPPDQREKVRKHLAELEISRRSWRTWIGRAIGRRTK